MFDLIYKLPVVCCPCAISYSLTISDLGEEVFELAKAMQKNETFRGKNEFRRVNLESDNARADMADFIEDLLDTGK